MEYYEGIEELEQWKVGYKLGYDEVNDVVCPYEDEESISIFWMGYKQGGQDV